MSKTSKKGADTTLRKYLVNTIIFAILTIAFAICLVIAINQLDNNIYTHDDLLAANYTFSHYEKVEYQNNLVSYEYKIYVDEEPDPLIIDSITSDAIDEELLDEIKKGDTLECQLSPDIDKRLEIVELYHDGIDILTLDTYKQKQDINAMLGIILMPIFSIITLGICIYYLIKFLNRRDRVKKSK